MKRYKLLKDLPDLKAGEIFEYNEDAGSYISQSMNKNHYLLYDDTVENNPEWFEPVKDDEIKKLNYNRNDNRDNLDNQIDPIINTINELVDAVNELRSKQ